jgi:hypothetical protein
MRYFLNFSKLTIKLWLVVWLISASSSLRIAQAQNVHPHLKRFNVETLNNKLLVTWTTKAGFTCQDVHIELSTDSIHWDRKATYFGICGDTTEKDYRLVVDSPYTNAVNYVRLVLGEFGFSQVLQIRVVDMGTPFKVVPHPANSNGKIYVENTAKENLTLQFYTLEGVLIEELYTYSNEFSLNDFPFSGHFIYVLLNKDRNPKQRGRILFIQR